MQPLLLNYLRNVWQGSFRVAVLQAVYRKRRRTSNRRSHRRTDYRHADHLALPFVAMNAAAAHSRSSVGHNRTQGAHEQK
jgi:hypothetical protein